MPDIDNITIRLTNDELKEILLEKINFKEPDGVDLYIQNVTQDDTNDWIFQLEDCV